MGIFAQKNEDGYPLPAIHAIVPPFFKLEFSPSYRFTLAAAQKTGGDHYAHCQKRRQR
jgi:hypothetical protein